MSYTPDRKHQILYTLRDRLGSGTTLADHNGGVVSRRYFDPFGRTASMGADHHNDLLGANVSLSKFMDLEGTNNYRRGFTDHEHLNEQQLIHMNGRIYDYNLGRFLSVDPVILDPSSTQAINPYSYIMNNPMAGTDPTGYCPTASRAGGGGGMQCVSILYDKGEDKGASGSKPEAEQSEPPPVNGAQAQQSTKVKGSSTKSDDATSGIGGALISKHVYGEGGELPDGVSQVSPEQLKKLKLDGLAFSDSDSGFQSALYYDSNNKSYIYAFAGTNGDGDMAENFAQGAGRFATQYDLALSNTKAIRSAVGGGLSLSGHSLGGGLASMAAALTGLSANTYNAAGVHMSTLARYSGGMANAVRLAGSANVNAYNVVGDGLTSLQRYSSFAPALPSALGRNISLTPRGLDAVIGMTPLYGGYHLHKMDTVINSLR
ncbi:RHS repeat-associated core domain-containing protein [Ferrimonas sediminicola]|uniref:RHS repeat-associated core domain-containing protein n=1 Tax=Ferrimonas sediminicola TaxID=2569538 RepID=UPI001E3CE04D|nr:RHS repeat-associated core domain-containing protein [Ferrimonas sediminicola]